ncbi:MAG: isoprenyl transferase [Microbacteriaceae bacterium]|nr:isoprenyl transferase [Microbacteriaceae bacterium]
MRNLIYRLYERQISGSLKNSELPKHVAVMLDGNRRWAEKNFGARAAVGHSAGGKKIHEFLGWCDELGIPVVTLYMLSIDNLTKRSDEELNDLLRIIGEVSSDLAKAKKWRVRLVGDREALPDALRSEIENAEKETEGLAGLHVNLAVAYGGRNEIAEAVKKLLVKHAGDGTSIQNLVSKLTPELITEHLYTTGQPDPDLIIRTSGEQRLSGFLLWQSSNSELYFEEALWPDFRRVDFLRALRAFGSRRRRFGA